MPSSPPTICNVCRGLKYNGVCNRCGQKRAKHSRTTRERGYGFDWQKFRANYLSDHPLCMDCNAEGIATAATEVHHRQKIKDRPDLKTEPENCMALCRKCHAARTAKGE